MSDCFEHARQIADAILYEGYLLYPYRAAASRNRVRWQFGVVAPRIWSEAGGCESSWMQLECLIQPGSRPTLVGIIRFLQVQRRTVEQVADPAGERFGPADSLEANGALWTSWDEGVEREIHLHLTGDLHPGIQRAVPFALDGGRDIEPIATASGRPVGRLVRERLPIQAELRFTVDPVDAAHPLLRLRVRIDNVTPSPEPGESREQALRSSLVGAHLLLAVQGGKFVSLLDPPEWARPAAAGCVNVRSWPVLTSAPEGHDVVLAAPIILYDHPQIAPESPLELHGETGIAAAPETRSIEVDGVSVARGSQVRLRPGRRRTDAQDMFLVDRLATVQGVFLDVEDRHYVAVTLVDDPAADLHAAHGRYLFFYPDEIEPIDDLH